LAIGLSSRRHRSKVPWMLVRLFSGCSPTPTRKSPPSSCECLLPTTKSSEPRRKGVWHGVWATGSREEPVSDSAVSVEEWRGCRRRIDRSSASGWARSAPYPFARNWLKSSLERLSDNSRKASLWTPKRAQNGARSAVSRPFGHQTQALKAALTIYQTVSWRNYSTQAKLLHRAVAKKQLVP
jgi:hypothetical protein